MQAAQFPKVVAFIEGSMERLFVNANFHYVHVVSLQNGDTWTTEAMCNQITSKFSVISYLPDFIVIWFDREKTNQSAETMSDEVRRSLVNAGYPAERLAVCVPDMMTENIILADEHIIGLEFGLDKYKYPGDGSNGKAALKGIYKSSGKNYKETFHGATLLKKIRLERSAKTSPSAQKFYEQLKLECWWKTA